MSLTQTPSIQEEVITSPVPLTDLQILKEEIRQLQLEQALLANNTTTTTVATNPVTAASTAASTTASTAASTTASAAASQPVDATQQFTHSITNNDINRKGTCRNIGKDFVCIFNDYNEKE